MRYTKIRNLMQAESKERDVDWLTDAMQAAIELEWTTIPPYLCALWSIEDETDLISVSIREVVHEEMMHMGIVCNILAGMGTSPVLASGDATPIYPGPLPGGVKSGTELTLAGLSRKSVQTFAAIEAPEPQSGSTDGDAQTYPSVGSFYAAILDALFTHKPRFETDRQLVGPLAPMVIRNLDDAKVAIELIVQQGEGASSTPVDTGPDDLAHYYRFMEVLEGRRLVYKEISKEWVYEGEDLPWPRSFLMGEVPKGGYKKTDVSSEVWEKLVQFDHSYSSLLRGLQRAWETGDLGLLIKSTEKMFEMRSIARALMQIPIGKSPQTYGPCFRYKD